MVDFATIICTKAFSGIFALEAIRRQSCIENHISTMKLFESVFHNCNTVL